MALPSSADRSPFRYFEDRYLTLDRRLLGLWRIYFGGLLLVDVLRRIPDAAFFYSNDGVLSNHYSLFAPMARPYFSLFTALSTTTEVRAGMLLLALVYGFYIAGYRTRLFQVLAFVGYASLNARNLFVENGGCVMLSVLLAWSVFLPLGDRFSVDALIKSLRARREFSAEPLNDRAPVAPPPSRYVTLVALGIALEIAIVYFFNTVHKNGPTWKAGEAVHWVLWQNRIATVWAAWLRMHEPSWLSPALSYGALAIEGAAPILVLSPFAQRYLRPAHFALTAALHLSIALLVSVGPFSYAMLALNALVLPASLFDAASSALGKRLASVELAYDESSARWQRLARLLSRLDSFGKLRFVPIAEAGLAKPSPVAARQGEGAFVTGKPALALVGRALPFGGLWASLLSRPWARGAIDAWLERVDPACPDPKRPEGAPPAELVPEPRPLLSYLGLSPAAVREGLVGVMLLTALIEASNDNWWWPRSLRVAMPQVLEPLVRYPRLQQGWTMFAPDAPRDDGLVVVDGVTADGRHLDPFTGQKPDFDAPLHGPWYHGQLYCDYHLKIHWDGNRGYRDELKSYLLNWQRIEGRPANDRIVSFKAYWVSNAAPPPGSTVPYDIQRTLLLEHGPQPAFPSLSSR